MGTWKFNNFYLLSTISIALLLMVIFKSYISHQDHITKEESINGSAEQPSWLKLKPEEMSAKDIMDYLNWSNSSSCKLAHDFGGKFWRNPPRGLDGQKAICILPQTVAPQPGSCIVYSMGINNEWSFDDTMEQYGCTVYAFDPSMKNVEDQFNRSSAIHFYKIGLSAQDETNSKGWKTLSLGSIRQLLGHQDRAIDYLKVDIDHAEWTVLPELMKTGELDQVKQMGFEIHLPDDAPLKRYQELVGILQSMEREHGMIRFDAKVNPWYLEDFKQLGFRGSLGYEIAWYNRKFL